MSANGEIIVNEKTNVLYVPIDAVVKMNGKSYVRVVNRPGKEAGNRNPEAKIDAKQQNAEQKVEMREVTTGISNAEYIEIVSGLKEGKR